MLFFCVVCVLYCFLMLFVTKQTNPYIYIYIHIFLMSGKRQHKITEQTSALGQGPIVFFKGV